MNSGGPLTGIKVLDLTRVLAGPFCTMMLGDMGAEVVKVEPIEGDETRQWGPPFLGGESTYFMSVNRNKKSIALDLRKDGGREALYRLVRWADVLVENFRPGVVERLGISYQKARELNPRIVYCSISGFGQTGPYRDKPGYDIVALAMSGLMSITGEAGRPPIRFGVPIADITAAMYAAFSVVAALMYREKTGLGQYIDVSLLDTQIYILTHQAANFFATGEEPPKLGSAHPNIAPYQAFEAGDGYFIVAVGNDRFWQQLCQALDLEELANDPRFRANADRVGHSVELVEILAEIFRENSTSHWLEKLEGAGVPCAPVKTLGEALNDPHTRQREMVVEVEHRSAGRVLALGVPAKLSLTPARVSLPPPGLGEHTDEVLASLGYSAEEVRALRAGGAVA